jgi:hypothetical protein
VKYLYVLGRPPKASCLSGRRTVPNFLLLSHTPKRFTDDFLFELTTEEFANLKSHFATSSWGGRRKLPLAFTEHGAIQAATILSAIRELMKPPESPRRGIGFTADLARDS